MSSGGASAGLERGRPDPARVGRRLGIALFWLMACYVIGMSALSIIPSLYWPESAPHAAAPRLEQCAREIAALDHELLAKSADAVRGHDPVALSRFLHDWDGRFMALSGGCGPLEEARMDLQRLRTHVETLLRTYQGSAQKTQERIRRALELLERPRERDRSQG